MKQEGVGWDEGGVDCRYTHQEIFFTKRPCLTVGLFSIRPIRTLETIMPKSDIASQSINIDVVDNGFIVSSSSDKGETQVIAKTKTQALKAASRILKDNWKEDKGDIGLGTYL